jgi:hypothetical protein
VDDFLIFTNDSKMQSDLLNDLGKVFPMKDLGQAHYCLGVRITQRPDEKVILLDQRENISRLLKRFGLSDAKPVSTPLETGSKLVKRAEGEEQTDAPYREAVGCLIHISQVTRPDICYAVGLVSQFCADPTEAHWRAVKRIMRYLKGTMDLQLKFNGKDRTPVEGFSDADWGGCLDCRKSTTGYVFKTAGASISWNSKKQPTVALSTTEAEYMACSAACQEIKWLLNLAELPSVNMSRPISLFCDNQGAVLLSANGIQHKRTKHIDLRHHFIREVVCDGLVVIKHVPTAEMIADILTKNLPVEKFRFCRANLGLV